LAIAIPISELILIKCNFFLDTIFLGFYTFVNCKVSLAGSMSTRQRENRNNGNQESSSKEASEEGSQENSKEEVSRQRNRQHNRGTPKASPDVFLGGCEFISVYAGAAHIATDQKVVREARASKWRRMRFRSMATMRSEFRVSCCRFRGGVRGGIFPRATAKNMGSELGRRRAPGVAAGEKRCPSYQSGTGLCHL
jgi:hypothetical protein